MALIFTGGTPAFSTGSVTTINVPLPTRVEGDYGVLACALNVSSGAISPPAGWSDILPNTDTTIGSTAGHHAIYYRKWVSGDPDAVDVTCASGRIAVIPVRVQNAHLTSFIEVAASVTQDPVADTSVDAPTITSSVTPVMCYTLMGRNATAGVFITWSPAGGDTEVGEAGSQAAAATNAACSFNTSTITPGTPSGTRTGTSSVTITGGMGVSFVLAQAAEGEPEPPPFIPRVGLGRPPGSS